MDHKPLHKHQVKLTEVPLDFEEKFKRIACPSCANNVPAENININDKIAKCNSCDVVFPFEKEIAELLPQQRMKQEILRPEGIDIFRFKDELDISIQQPFVAWELISMILTAPFGIIGIVGLTVGTLKSIAIGLVFLTIFSSVMFFTLFKRYKQRIHITIDDKFLFLEWRPKKFIKDKRYNIDEISQIYTKTMTNIHYVYMIVNGTDGEKHIPLIKNVGSISKARYLEQEIEKHIGIQDRQVPEESI